MLTAEKRDGLASINKHRMFNLMGTKLIWQDHRRNSGMTGYTMEKSARFGSVMSL